MGGVVAKEEIEGVTLEGAIVAPLRCAGGKSSWEEFSGADLL